MEVSCLELKRRRITGAFGVRLSFLTLGVNHLDTYALVFELNTKEPHREK